MYYPVKFGISLTAIYTGAGSLNPVILPNGKIYVFFIDSLTSDPVYTYSVDHGRTWSNPVSFKACTCTNMAVWYDRWSGISADLAHVVYTDSVTDDTFYRTLDLSNDTLGTERTVFAGASTAAGGALSVTRARGGNVMVATCIDAGVEYDTRKTVDLGVNWTSTTTDVFEAATTDQILLLPGWNADNQDVMAIFWDASADEISVKRYDDSADTWAETSISTGMVDIIANTGTFPHFAVSVDLTNSQNILIAWNAIDTASADLLCWTITDTTITAKTNVITDSTDDQAFAALSINGSTWTAFYFGIAGGSETYNSQMSLHYKISTDGGTNWSSEKDIFYNNMDLYTSCLFSPIINYNDMLFCIWTNPNRISLCNAKYISSKATYQLGI